MLFTLKGSHHKEHTCQILMPYHFHLVMSNVNFTYVHDQRIFRSHKNLVTKNSHAKYQSPTSYSVILMANAEILDLKCKPRAMCKVTCQIKIMVLLETFYHKEGHTFQISKSYFLWCNSF